MAGEAEAGFLYDFKFDALDQDGYSFPASEFMARSPMLLQSFSDMTTDILPPATLNGFSVQNVSIGGIFGGGLTYVGDLNGSNLGDIKLFEFTAPGADAGVGIYPTDTAGRGVITDFNNLSADVGFEFTTGSLTISEEVATVIPEPASLALWSLVGSVFVVGGLRRRQKRMKNAA
jgi:hypothetical protein